MTLSEHLKSLDSEARAALAKRCGTSVEYLSQLASGIRKPKAQLAITISKETGGSVSCEELLPDVDWEYLREAALQKGAGGGEDPGVPDPKSEPLDGEGERRSDQPAPATGSSVFPGSSDPGALRSVPARTLLDEEAA